MTKKKENESLHYAELHDIPRDTISGVKKQIELTMKYEQHRGAFAIIGHAGIGKSQIVSQLAKDNGYRVYDIRTAHYGLVGAGIPSTKNSPEGYFDLLVPSCFPKKGEKAIMLFEELNQGLPHTINMFFSLVEDRRMFNYELPNDAVVIALMNPATAQYAVTSIENNAALRRRLKWVFAVDSFKDWYAHAKSPRFHETDEACLKQPKACHPNLLAFLKTFPTNLYDSRAQEQNKQYMCPATSQTVSLDMHILEKDGVPLSSDFAVLRYAASIGTTMATQLQEYIKDATVAVKADDVLENYKKKAQKAVVKLLEQSSHEKIAELNSNVLQYLFGVQPDAKVAASNLVDYMLDLSNDLRSAILNQLKPVAESNQALEYLFDVVRNMQRHKNWIDVHKQLDDAQTFVEAALKTA